MKTKKQLLAELTAPGAVVTATIAGNMVTLDDWPALEAKLSASGWKQLPDKADVWGNPGTGQYIGKPKLTRVRTGTIHATASRYDFRWLDAIGKMSESSGATKDLKVDGDALALTMFNGCVIRYALNTQTLTG